ncbi:MAG: DNA-protecting protein DprA [Holophagales bacterium]|nr:DNA-protecting protein DprA [Holophagales bacterium]MYG30643.1 DNA-protecting protein DprA [Holophagales bacterium]MYI81583.1 DNA-protecting protein DprA [Holophagales bacterium]
MAEKPVPNGNTPRDADDVRKTLVALNLVHGDRGLICALAQRLRTAGELRSDRFAEEAASSLEAPLDRVRTILFAARGRLDDARAEMARASEDGVDIVTLFDPEYPPALADLGLQAPPVLYVRGRLSVAPGISIVGSRKADAYGLEVAAWFARRLAAAGLVIISGFARGIDQAAHRSALAARAGTGSTAAVLGCGIDVDYPRNSRRTAAEIARHGCLITEFPLGRQPRAHHFPIRNRLIAALGFASLVVRAARRSGSLITARLALDLGRDVYAVPGSVLSQESAGAHLLLRDGAIPALDPDAMLEILPTSILAQLERPQRDTAEPTRSTSSGVSDVDDLLVALREGARTPEELASRLQRPVPGVLATLARLEVDGLVRRYEGANYALMAR